MFRAVIAVMLAATFFFSSVPARALTCVAYVRAVTGFDLSGNAWQWWNSASGVYSRGQVPEPGSVIVFSRTRHMRDGHVAVVRRVLGTREIVIDQANWAIVHHHRGAITKSVRVIDASDDNDWSVVRVQWGSGDDFGRMNPVSGFIYPDADTHANQSDARFLEARARIGEENVTDSDDGDGDNAQVITAPASGKRGHHQIRCRVPARQEFKSHKPIVMTAWKVASVGKTIGDARLR